MRASLQLYTCDPEVRIKQCKKKNPRVCVGHFKMLVGMKECIRLKIYPLIIIQNVQYLTINYIIEFQIIPQTVLGIEPDTGYGT